MSKFRLYLDLYLNFKAQYLKTQFAYRANFFLMLISGILLRAVVLTVPWLIFRQVPNLASWSFAEVVYMTALVILSESLCNLGFDGLWHLQNLVFQGDFDVMLVRPISPFFQILSYEIGLQGLGSGIAGLVGLVYSLQAIGHLNVCGLLMSLLFIVTGTLFRLAINSLTACLIFWLGALPADPMFMVHTFGESARYPLDLYPVWMQVLLLIVPYGLIGYVPTLILLGRLSELWLLVLVALAVLGLWFASRVFRLGVQRYESAGM